MRPNKQFKTCKTAILSLLLLLSFSCAATSGESSKTKKKDQETIPVNHITVYYFHTTYRCYSCNQIEKLTKQAIETGFAKELKDKEVIFKAVNLDEGNNMHFRGDYNLYGKSVVISLVKDKKEIEHKNLPDIWSLLRNEEKFIRYIQDGIRLYYAKLTDEK